MAEKPKGTAKAAKAKQHHPSDDGATEIPVTSHAESPATHDEEAPLDNRGDVNRGALSLRLVPCGLHRSATPLAIAKDY